MSKGRPSASDYNGPDMREVGTLAWIDVGVLVDTGSTFETISAIEIGRDLVTVETREGSQWVLPAAAQISVYYPLDEDTVSEG